MGGFFAPNKYRTKIDTGKHKTCAACGLWRHVKSPRMKPFGNFKKKILNIGEAPGEFEDARGKQWQGKMGQALQIAYKKFGINLFEDCLNINSCNCRPMDKSGFNRPPTDAEIGSCRHQVFRTIMEHQPHVIMAFGQSSIVSILGSRWLKDLDTISKWRGWHIPDRELHAWICPTFHPSYVERGEKEIMTVWMQDLEEAFKMVDKPFPEFENEATKVEIVTDLSCLDTLGEMIAFDYETTGLKPHAEGHKVVCMSVCDDKHCYSFMIPENKEPVVKLLQSDRMKIAQNMKFEDNWTEHYFGAEVNNWVWDPMLASHVLDNRQKVTGLKFQAYVNFGVIDYDSEVSSFLKGKEPKNGNSFNKIDELVKTEAGRNKLLTYCGMDSIFEYRLAKQQMETLKWKKKK